MFERALPLSRGYDYDGRDWQEREIPSDHKPPLQGVAAEGPQKNPNIPNGLWGSTRNLALPIPRAARVQ